MPSEYFNNILLLIIVLENILSKLILKSSLDIFKAMLNKFLFDLDDHIFVSGIHELTHMIDSIIQFGNPNNLNLMQFEELNITLTRSIN